MKFRFLISEIPSSELPPGYVLISVVPKPHFQINVCVGTAPRCRKPVWHGQAPHATPPGSEQGGSSTCASLHTPSPARAVRPLCRLHTAGERRAASLFQRKPMVNAEGDLGSSSSA